MIKQIIYKAKMKKWCKALNEFDLTELENKGNYILSLCVDKETGNTFEPIEHHLPLIDTARSEQDINNWDLSENVKNTVKSYQKDLLSYADMVIRVYYKPCSDMVDVLPLWIVFPTYSATTIGWRMGLGEQYEYIYPDSAKLKTLQRVSKKCESSHYIFREQGGVYEREQ